MFSSLAKKFFLQNPLIKAGYLKKILQSSQPVFYFSATASLEKKSNPTPKKKIDIKDLESQIQACKSINDYHNCINNLLQLADWEQEHRVHREKINQFLHSIHQTIRFQSVPISFLKKAVKFLYKYQYLAKFDLHSLVKRILDKKRTLVETQDDFIEITNYLVSTFKDHEEIKRLLHDLEATVLLSLEELNSISVINFYYYYGEFAHTKNETLLSKLEKEIIARADQFQLKETEEFIKVFSLLAKQPNPNHDIFTLLETNLLSNLDRLSEAKLNELMRSLSSYPEFSKPFCAEFQNYILKNFESLSTKTLLMVLNFVTLEQFRLSHDLIVTIENEIMNRRVTNVNKWLQKDMSDSKHYYDKNSLINNIFKYAINFIESKDQISPPSEKVKALKEDIINSVGKVKDPFEFKLLINLCAMLRIYDVEVLDTFFKHLIKLKGTNELSLSYLANVLSCFFDLNYGIKFDQEEGLFNLLVERMKTRIHEASPATAADLVKIICRVISQGIEKEKTVELMTILRNKIINEKYFFVAEERIELLSYLTISPETADKDLINYIFKFFNPDTNKFFSKEIKFVNFRKFYQALYKARKYEIPIETNNPDIETLSQRGSERIDHLVEKNIIKHQNSSVHRDIKTTCERLQRENPDFKYQQSLKLECYPVDFVIEYKDKKIYFDVFEENQTQINDRSRYDDPTLAKLKFLRYCKHNYQHIAAREVRADIDPQEFIKQKIFSWVPELQEASKPKEQQS